MSFKLQLVIAVIFLNSLQYSCQANVEKPYYRAAVVEFHHIRKGRSTLDIANDNGELLIKITKKAKTYGAEIVVFPEIGLSPVFKNKSELLDAATVIPDESLNLCQTDKTAANNCLLEDAEYQKYLKAISCVAKTASIYVVINVHEKHSCEGSSNCPSDGFHIFNTNVVFDREGKVISRYRKYNLFGLEAYDLVISKPQKAELATFTTDFNVTFGQFICFDVLFKSPALELVQKKGITDFVYPTHWYSELPFLTATQAQLGFSYANDVNFLASNINYPSTAIGGSGIYAGMKGPLVISDTKKPANTLLVANVPKFAAPGKRFENVDFDPVIYRFNEEDVPTIDDHEAEMKWMRDYIYSYTTEDYDPTSNGYDGTICNNGLCCHFKIESSWDLKQDQSNYYRYKMAVFKGNRVGGIYFTYGIEVCSIIACTDDHIQSCGVTNSKEVQYPLTLKHISISRSVDNDDVHFTPSVYTTDLNVMDTNSFSFTVNQKEAIDNKQKSILLSLTKPRNDLFAFAIYGRDEKQDGKPIAQ